jgi:hypothetical protein
MIECRLSEFISKTYVDLLAFDTEHAIMKKKTYTTT